MKSRAHPVAATHAPGKSSAATMTTSILAAFDITTGRCHQRHRAGRIPRGPGAIEQAAWRLAATIASITSPKPDAVPMTRLLRIRFRLIQGNPRHPNSRGRVARAQADIWSGSTTKFEP
jgi:hypothetical protein